MYAPSNRSISLLVAPSLSFFSPPSHKRINASAWLQPTAGHVCYATALRSTRSFRLSTVSLVFKRATCLDNAQRKYDDTGIDIITACRATIQVLGPPPPPKLQLKMSCLTPDICGRVGCERSVWKQVRRHLLAGWRSKDNEPRTQCA